MSRFPLFSVGALALTLAAPAYAADLPQRPVVAPPMVVPVYNWTGFYVGGNLGGAWSNVDVTGNFTGATWSFDQTNFIAGGQVGYNYQIGAFVIGVEWDFDWADGEGSTAFRNTQFGRLRATTDSSWVTTVAARLGYAADRWLFYTKLGGGWTEIDASLRTPGGVAVASGTASNSGWLVGAGVEYAFAINWTAKIEYNYLGLSDKTFTTRIIAPGRSVTVSPDVQMVKFGINYKFF